MGLAAALTAFGIWGFLPQYFHLIGPRVSVWKVLSHRIVWATVLLAAYTVFSGRLPRLRVVFGKPAVLLALMASALCIGQNWVVFIWAVTHGHVLDSSLGYYITPLLNVVMGMIFLGERLRSLQWLAVALAALGVAIMIGAGVITVVPLLLFATGARRLRLGTIGLLQYLTPTMQF